MRKKITLGLALIVAIVYLTLPDNAMAWRGHHHHHGSHVGVSFNYGYPAYGGYGYPYYYRPRYYRPYPVYYAPPPVVYTRPLVVETQPVYVRENQQQAYNPPQDERYCREYTDNINVGGQVSRTYGTACQQPDGSWEIQ